MKGRRILSIMVLSVMVVSMATSFAMSVLAQEVTLDEITLSTVDNMFEVDFSACNTLNEDKQADINSEDSDKDTEETDRKESGYYDAVALKTVNGDSHDFGYSILPVFQVQKDDFTVEFKMEAYA